MGTRRLSPMQKSSCAAVIPSKPIVLSEPKFFLMAQSEDRHLFLIETVARNIAAVTEIDTPFPIMVGKIFNKTADVGMCTERLKAFHNRLACSLRRQWVFGTQEIPKSFKVTNGSGRENYLWHSGVVLSPSVPHVESHFSTSPAVT